MAYPNSYPPQGTPPYANNYPPQGVAPYQEQGIPQSPYQLTREEKRVLKECGQESFYRRCLPFMTALGLGAYYGVHLGYLKGHPIYMARPKVICGILVGYIAGKLSYKNQCEEKILRLPGGRLKESILASRNPLDRMRSGSADDGGVYTNASIAYALPPYTSASFRSNERSTASEWDAERHHDTFDDSFRIRSGDNVGSGDSEDLTPLVPPTQSTSYSELRLRNREEYDARRKQYSRPGQAPVDDYSAPSDRFTKTDAYQSPTAAADRASKSSVYQTPTGGFDQYSQTNVEPQKVMPAQRKNFYGDVIER